jgi:hypothetical protein
MEGREKGKHAKTARKKETEGVKSRHKRETERHEKDTWV